VTAVEAWERLRACAAGCLACPELAASRTSVVFGQWPRGADVLLVGEAPGAEEDAAGEPFVGRSGRLLDRLLAEAGLDRGRVAVTNVLKCRPPGNRPPRPAEVANCRTWLDRQIALVGPLVVVALGATATAALLGRDAKVTKVRGEERVVDGRVVVATYHPSAALRFGPAGEPAVLLGRDLAHAARLAAALRAAADR
jgi:DNA polymerase